MNENLCPICHSIISPIEDQEWTDDPMLTPRGLAGEDYRGFFMLNLAHIKELQDKRKEQEIEVGIPEEERTKFTEIVPGKTKWNKKHINELRESIEKILSSGEAISLEEREELLNQYFNYDESGNYIGTYKYGQKIEDKKDWTENSYNLTGIRTSYTELSEEDEEQFQIDYANYATEYGVNPDPDAEEHRYDYRALWRDTGGIFPDEEGHLPSEYKLIDHSELVLNGTITSTGQEIFKLPSHLTKIKAIHIEDLRHPINLSNLCILSNEMWVYSIYNRLYKYNRYLYTPSKSGEVRDKIDFHATSSLEEGRLKTADGKYMWSVHPYGSYYWIIGHEWNSDAIKSIYFSNQIQAIFSDGIYLWVIVTDYKWSHHFFRSEVDTINQLYKVKIEDMTKEYIGNLTNPEPKWTFGVSPDYLTTNVGYFHLPEIISIDKNYLYVMWLYVGIIGTNPGSHWRIEKVKKSDLEIESSNNLNTVHDIASIDNPHNDSEHLTRNSYEAIVALTPYTPFTSYSEDWSFFEAYDNDNIYLRKIVKWYRWDYSEPYREEGGGFAWWAKDWGVVEEQTITDEIFTISRKDFGTNSFKEVREIIGEGRDYQILIGDEHRTYHIDKEIKSIVIDKKSIYFLCCDFTVIDKRGYYPVLSEGFLKVYNKKGTLIKQYNQDIGEDTNPETEEIETNFSFDKYEEVYDEQGLETLRFDLSMISKDQIWFNNGEVLEGEE